MSSSEAIIDALADLQGAVVAGQSLDVAVVEIANEYGIKQDVLLARAQRDGGVVESANKLKQRSELVRLINAFEKQGLLFGYPRPQFPVWYENEVGSTLSATDAAFAHDELKLRLERAQQRNLQRVLMGIHRIRSDAEN